MRLTINLPDAMASALEARAKSEARSVSNYTCRLIEADVRKHLGGPEHADLIAYAEEVGIDVALAAVKREARKTKKHAA